MPKQRLADFRGGLNQKISSHMIGETQGQSAKDVDLGAVRLQGRKALNSTTPATGNYYYETGLQSGGRFVSIHPADNDTTDPNNPYIQYASDFATWNLDLYVATGNPGLDGTTYGDGKLIVFRDGSQTAVLVDFRPPESVSATSSFQADTQLVAAVGEITYSNVSTKVTASNATIAQWGSNNQAYTVTAAADHSGYFEWTRPGITAKYYTTSQTSGDLKNRTGGSAGTTYPAVNLTTHNAGSAGFGTSGVVFTISGIEYEQWERSGGTGTLSPNASMLCSRKDNVDTRLYTYTGGPSVPQAVTPASGSQAGMTYSWFFAKAGSTGATTPISSTNYWRVVVDLGAQTGTISVRRGSTTATHTVTGVAATISTRTFTDTDGRTFNREGSDDYDKSAESVAYNTAGHGGSVRVMTPANGSLTATVYTHVKLPGESTYRQFYAGYSFSQFNPTETTFVTPSISGYTMIHSQTIHLYSVTRGSTQRSSGTETINGVNYTYKEYDLAFMNAGHGTREYKVSQDYNQCNVMWGGVLRYESQAHLTNPTTVTGNDGATYTRWGSTGTGAASNLSGVIRSTTASKGSGVTYTPSPESPTFTYGGTVNDSIITEASPGTDAFHYDDARLYIHSTITNAAASWDEDPAKFASPGWLDQNRTFTTDDHGYYLYTVRNASGTPSRSQKGTKATFDSTSKFAFESGLFRTPNRLNFTVTAPNDDSANTGQPLVCYMLERRDSLTTSGNPISLCYVLPGGSESFTRSSNTLTVSGLTSGTKYRLYWTGYYGTTAKVAASDTATKSSPMGGYSFTASGTTQTLTLVPVSGKYTGIDVWLDREVMTDLYARVQCCEVFVGGSLNLANSCDFLDLYPESLGCSGLSGANRDGVPSYLKFITESNNFFFAVGTLKTEVERYGDSTERENKAGAFLFISEYNNPREWPITGYVEFEDEITGISHYPGELVVWTRHGTYRVFGSRPDQMRKIKLATAEGMPVGNHTTAALVGRYLVWASQTGICIYDGASVANLTRPRLNAFPTTINNGAASQFEGKYYLVKSDETGWMVDFNLEGFPLTEIDLREGGTDTQPHPVLVYRPQTNTLYSRRGAVEGSSTRNSWSYQTRGFDGNNFGAMKLVKSITLNGTGSGYVQVNLDGRPVFSDNSNKGKQVSIAYAPSGTTVMTQPVRVYLPASYSDSPFGLAVADVWDVQITDWQGDIDWIDTEYEVLSGA